MSSVKGGVDAGLYSYRDARRDRHCRRNRWNFHRDRRDGESNPSLEQRTLANWIASNHLTRMRMLQRREGNRSLREQANPLGFRRSTMEVETKIKTTEHPWIRRIEVSVFEATDEEGRQGPYSQFLDFWPI